MRRHFVFRNPRLLDPLFEDGLFDAHRFGGAGHKLPGILDGNHVCAAFGHRYELGFRIETVGESAHRCRHGHLPGLGRAVQCGSRIVERLARTAHEGAHPLGKRLEQLFCAIEILGSARRGRTALKSRRAIGRIGIVGNRLFGFGLPFLVLTRLRLEHDEVVRAKLGLLNIRPVLEGRLGHGHGRRFGNELELGPTLDLRLRYGPEEGILLEDIVRILVDEVVELLVAVVVLVVVVAKQIGLGHGDRLEARGDIFDLAAARQQAQLFDDVLAVANADDFLGGRDALGRRLERRRRGVGLGLGARLLAPSRELGLPVRGANVRKDAQHGRHGRLVVVHAGRARGKTLGHCAHAQEKQRQRGHDAHSPDHCADGIRQENKGLDQRRHEHHANEHKALAADEREIARELRAVEEALVRRVVVGDDDDGARALDDGRPRRGVVAHDVLAVGFAAESAHEGLARRVQKEKDRSGKGKNRAHDKRPALGKAAQKDAQEKRDLQGTAKHGAHRRAFELFDGHVDALSRHHVGDGFGGEILFLAVCRSDGDLVIENVEKILGFGHDRVPLSVRLPRRARSFFIRNSVYAETRKKSLVIYI